ncbi:hypothetical protein Aperf_G00000074444 [Anoplocephala perfoliata]
MPPKKRKGDEEESDDGLVHLELEGFSPAEQDRDGIIQMLNQLLPKTATLYLGGLADYIISRGRVGTVVKSSQSDSDDEEEDDDDDIVFSTTSLINLFEPSLSQFPAVKDLREFLEGFISSSKSSNPDATKLLSVLRGSSSEKPALLINERYVNLPPEIAEKSVSSLLEEINDLPDEEKPSHLIIMTRAIKSPVSSELIYIQPEMENVRRFALAVSETNVKTPTFDDENEVITFVVMAVDVPSLPEILDVIAASK